MWAACSRSASQAETVFVSVTSASACRFSSRIAAAISSGIGENTPWSCSVSFSRRRLRKSSRMVAHRTGNSVPTLHAETAVADHVSARVYDVSGDLVYAGQMQDAVTMSNGKVAYEMQMPAGNFKSGVYIGVVTADRDGKETIRRQFKFTVVK